jgi:hypothetical protein
VESAESLASRVHSKVYKYEYWTRTDDLAIYLKEKRDQQYLLFDSYRPKWAVFLTAFFLTN